MIYLKAGLDLLKRFPFFRDSPHKFIRIKQELRGVGEMIKVMILWWLLSNVSFEEYTAIISYLPSSKCSRWIPFGIRLRCHGGSDACMPL